ncbi:tetratricopeptide repeat protein [Sphingopyxis fribergensis]
MVPGKLKWLASAGLLMLAMPLSVAAQESVQGTSLLGKPMVTTQTRSANIAATETLDRAARDAKAAYEANMTVDSATWYGRILFYQGYSKESAAVYDQALKRFPNSGKLLRHRAHRAFSLREFDKSIELGLKAAKLYENQPLEREKPGPDYFPGDPDVVQYYLYYHLGQAYFAKHDFDNAAKWFAKSAESAAFTHDVEARTANGYWEYLSLARAGKLREAQALLDDYDLTLFEVHPKGGSDTYFDGLQLFKGHRAADSFFSDKDSGRAFATADGVAASTAYSLANYYILSGEPEKAKPWLQRSINVDSWGFFARIQAEADWLLLFPGEQP